MTLLVMLLQEGSWESAAPWISVLPGFLAVLPAFLLLLVVLRALRRRRFSQVEWALPEDRLAAVQQAIHEAEQRTVGEILPVVLGRSDPHPAAEYGFALLAGLTAFLVPWAAGVLTDPGGLLLAGLLGGLLGRLAARRLPELARPFVAPSRLEEVTAEQAIQEFFGHDLHETEARTGVLLFVSLFERRVVVLGDRGIAERVDPEVWDQVKEDVLTGAREGDLARGLVTAIGRMADILAEEFPWREGDRNEIPDRVVVRPA